MIWILLLSALAIPIIIFMFKSVHDISLLSPGGIMKWNPEEYNPRVESFIPQIKEPPCKDCKHFRPHRRFKTYGEPDGVRICQAEHMKNDFKCYEDAQNIIREYEQR